MPEVPLKFPVGVSDRNPFAKDGNVTAPPESARNVRMTEVSGRLRPTARNRVAKAFQDQLPGGVADLLAVGKATDLETRYGPLRPLAGGQAIGVTTYVPRSQDTVEGSCRIIDADGNSYFGFADPDYPSETCVGVASDECENITPTRGDRFRGAFAINYTKAYGGSIGNQVITRVSYLKETPVNAGGSGPITRQWTAEIEDKAPGGSVTAAAVDLPCKAVAVCGPWVFVAVRNYVYCIAADTSLGYTAGQVVQRYQIETFSTIQAISVACNVARDPLNGNIDYASNTAELLIAGDGWTTVVGDVTTNTNLEGLYYRAGVERATVNLFESGEDALTVAPDPFAAQQAPITESHNAWRFSKWIPAGRGRVVFGMVMWNQVGEDTQAQYRTADLQKDFIVTSNDGFGPTNAADDKPNGDGGYANLFCLDNGRLYENGAYSTADPIKWAADANSRKTDWQGTGYFNDIPYDASGAIDPDNGVGPEPSLTCVTVNPATGDCFTAGKDSNGLNVYSHAMNNGGTRWATTVGAFVPQGCIGFYAPQSSVFADQTSVVVAAARNDDWPGSEGEFATLFFLDPATGSIRATRDFGSGIEIKAVAGGKRYVMVGSEFF